MLKGENRTVTSITNALGAVTTSAYDANGNVTKMTDERGNSYTYTYDKNNLLLTETDPLGNTKYFGYDKNSEIVSVNENQIMEVVYPDEGITKFEYDANGNKTFKEYPNYETAYYFYDACDQVIEMDEYNLGGKKFYKTTYSWDAEGNLLTEMQYNHGQSGQTAVTRGFCMCMRICRGIPGITPRRTGAVLRN